MAPSLSGELPAKKEVCAVSLEILDSTALFDDRDTSELFKQALPSTAVMVWRCSKKNRVMMSELTPTCLATHTSLAYVGPMGRALREPMTSCISRRKSCWTMLLSMDHTLEHGDTIRAKVTSAQKTARPTHWLTNRGRETGASSDGGQTHKPLPPLPAG